MIAYIFSYLCVYMYVYLCVLMSLANVIIWEIN